MRKHSRHHYFTRTAQPRTNIEYICYVLVFATADYGNSEFSESFNSVIYVIAVSTEIFKFCLKCSLPIISLFPILICAMLMAHRISPQALYGYYKSYGINFDTLDRILLDPFLIILEMFVKINTR
jgi:hypothetical protein